MQEDLRTPPGALGCLGGQSREEPTGVGSSSACPRGRSSPHAKLGKIYLHLPNSKRSCLGHSPGSSFCPRSPFVASHHSGNILPITEIAFLGPGSCGAGQSHSDQDPTSRLFHRRKNKILANMVQGVVFFLQLHIVHIRGKTGTARLY